MWFKKKSYVPRSPLLEEKPLKISFCISHKDRFNFLKGTLGKNLEDNRYSQFAIEFLLVDFSDSAEPADWVRSNFKTELENDYLKLFHSSKLKSWHAAIAKNTAHALATGQVLVNLDCDNFTGRHGGDFVMQSFLEASENIIFWQYTKRKLDGTYGRIGMTRDTFQKLGGYNEEFLPMGFQDGDLIDRAKEIDVRVIRNANPDYNQAIKHEKFKPKDISWKKMNEHNERLSKKRIREGKLVANEGNFRGLSASAERIK